MSAEVTPEMFRTAAHALVDIELAVFPLQDGPGEALKAPATAHGFKDATKDHDQVERWWGANGTHRGRGIAIATGEPSNLCVIDVDDKRHANPPKHGLDTLAALEAELGPLPRTVTVSTPGSAGPHLYFRRPPGGLASGADVLGDGIDVKCDGGYVVAILSEHPNGGRYRWALDDHGELKPSLVEVVELPDAWVKRARAGRSATGDVPPLSADDYEPLLSMFRAANGFTVQSQPSRTEHHEWRATRFGKRSGCSVGIYPHPEHHAHVFTSNAPGFHEKDQFWHNRPGDFDRLAELLAVEVPDDPDVPPEPDDDDEWPELDEAALYGLAGDVVRAIMPHTESDPVNVLLTYLAFFGAAVGRGPHADADGAEHPARLFAVLVGESAKARKGSGLNHVRSVFTLADAAFTNQRLKAGFGSGEAVVDAVAEDDDPRLLVIEPEWTRVLLVSARDGSTLSPLLRQGWDGDRLEVRTRGKKSVAEGAHLVVIGHVTADELRTRLTETDRANGFANRHLFALVKRSKLLPSGGKLDGEAVIELGKRTGEALRAARTAGVIRRTSEAEAFWERLYCEMAHDEPGGLLGAIVARDQAQVLRLSVAYALTDGSRTIELAHLEAAWALWSYCRRSAGLIFGDAIGLSVADRILTAVREAGEDGITLDDLQRHFSRHLNTTARDAALAILEGRDQIRRVTEETGGRPRVTLFCAATKAI